MKDIIKYIAAHLLKTLERAPEQTPEQTPERLLERAPEIDTERMTELVYRQLRMRTIFPHLAVIRAGGSYGAWYARVAGVWQRRRQEELQGAPTEALRQIIGSVMAERLATAREVCTTLH